MKKLMLIGLVVLAMVLVGAGCVMQYSDSVLTGTIGSTTFTFADGYVDSDGWIEMFDEEKDFTDAFSYDDTYPQIFFTLDAVEVGTYDLKLLPLSEAFTVTGHDGTTNYIYSDGYVEILTVTATEVTGGMYINTGDGTLDGTFTLEVVDW